MTLLFIVLAVVPIIQSKAYYSTKIAVAVVAANLVAFIYYRVVALKSAAANRVEFAES